MASHLRNDMRLHTLFAAAIGVAAYAQADEFAAVSGWETSISGDYTVVLVPDAGDKGVDGQPALYEASLGLDLERVLDNGAEIGARTVLRVQRDHPARAGFSGCLGQAGGQNIASTLDIGAFSGVSAGCAPEDIGPRGSLETAFLYLNGGYGEVLVGRDMGVAARFQEGAHEVFSHARIADPLLDPSGISSVRVRADVSGPAEKITYTSPRLLGLRAGLSYTPKADVRGLDRDPARAIGGLAQPEIEDVWEGGLNFSRRFRDSGIRVRAGLGYAHGEIDGSASAATVGTRGSVSTWSAGGELEWEQFSVGASWLQSDNGRTDADYTGWTAGASTEQFGLTWSASIAEATDDAAGVDSRNWSVGVGREVGLGIDVRVGLQNRKLSLPGNTLRSEGLVFEITQSL